MRRFAAWLAGSGPQALSSYWISNLYPFKPDLLSWSSASSMPCLSCAPKYDPGPDIGSRPPILMTLSAAGDEVAVTASRQPAIDAARANVENAFMKPSHIGRGIRPNLVPGWQ